MPEGITDFSSQRPAIEISPSALTRHVLFRIPKDKNPRFTAGPLWEPILSTLADHMNELCASYAEEQRGKVSFLQPGERSDETLRKYSVSRSATITITDKADRGFRFRVRVDVYTELISLTYIVDRIDTRCSGPIATAFAALDGDQPGTQRSRHDDLDWLYTTVWTGKEGIPCLGKAYEWCLGPEARKVGQPLSDFRGIILRSVARPSPKPKDDKVAADQGDDGRGDRRKRQKGLSRGLEQFLDRRHDDLIPHAIGRLGNQPRSLMSGEPVLCGMLDGDALYIAELGRRNDAGTIEPVKHLLVFDRAPSEQIGRLVRRLHVLGEYRHAALMDYDNEGKDDLKHVSRRLRELGPELDREFIRFGTPVSGSNLDTIFGIVSQVGELKANEEEGGLSFRIEQSRYYAREFTKTVPHLRIVRLRTYQSYEDFAARYIYRIFSGIDRIGVRYDAFVRRLSLAANFQISKEIETYQFTVEGSLDKLQGSVRDLNTAIKSVESASNSQKDVSEKQTSLLDEAALLGLLIATYYTGSAMHHWSDISIADWRFFDQKQWFLLIWPLVVLMIAVLVVMKFVWRKFEKPPTVG